MSVFGIEQALYDISVRREIRTRFKEDPQTVLAGYALTADEQQLIAAFKVADLYRRGVSPLLTMGFWMTAAPERSLPAYLRSMRT